MELNFKDKFSRADFEALKSVIEYVLLNLVEPNVEERLMLANLHEIHHTIRKKQVELKTEYKLTLTAPQAIALRLMYLLYMQDEAKELLQKSKAGALLPSLMVKMMMVCNKIDHQYQITDERTKVYALSASN